MPRIMFDNQQDTRSENYGRHYEEKFRFERKDRCYSRSDNPFRKEDYEIEKRCFDRPSNTYKEKKNTSKRTHERHDFPSWAAIALFSLLGAFALFTPIITETIPYEKSNLTMSLTGLDFIKTAFENKDQLKDINKIWAYLATMVAFVVSMATSIIMRERIEEQPLIPTIAGVVAIAGIFITFGYATIVETVVDNHGICLAIQLVCAIMIIALNIIPLKNTLTERNRTASKRRAF